LNVLYSSRLGGTLKMGSINVCVIMDLNTSYPHGFSSLNAKFVMLQII